MVQTGWDLLLLVTLMFLTFLLGYETAKVKHKENKDALSKLIGVRPVYLDRLIEIAMKKHGDEV